jgi:hypothetical protein
MGAYRREGEHLAHEILNESFLEVVSGIAQQQLLHQLDVPRGHLNAVGGLRRQRSPGAARACAALEVDRSQKTATPSLLVIVRWIGLPTPAIHCMSVVMATRRESRLLF